MAKLFSHWMLFGFGVFLCGGLRAATIQWTGAGGNDSWSTPTNWSGGVVPGDGDDVLFGANSSTQASLNFSLQLGSFTFASDATYTPIHVGAGTASTLTLSGAGIINDPGVGSGGPIRQDFFADAGGPAGGGTILFANTASVTGNHNVNLTANGADIAGGIGGTIIFQDHSSTAASANFTALVAGGASVAGGGGGTVILRGDALAQGNTQLVIRDGTALGAGGGLLMVQDRARIESNVTNLSGDGGLGGRIDVHDNAALVNGLLENFGAFSTQVGEEAVTRFFNNSSFNGVAQNFAGNGDGFAGGRLEFHDDAIFGIGSTDPTFGQVEQIINLGSSVTGALGGKTIFYDDSTVVGTTLTIRNDVEGESVAAGTQGGTTEFRDRSHAGQVTIYNAGATNGGVGTLGGRTLFYNNSSAELASITVLGGSATNAVGGRVEFHDDTTAGSSSLLAFAGSNGGQGGVILFTGNATGALSHIYLDGNGTADAGNGTLDISGSTRVSVPIGSLEGTAGLVNLGDRNLAVGGNGATTFFGGTIQGSGGSLTKEGSGGFYLGGINTYTGNTLVSAGQLVVDFGTLTSPLVSVSSGATLGGNGTLLGQADLAAGATLAPGFGAGPATFSVGALTSVSGANLNFRLGAAGVVGGPKNDLLVVSGNLTLAGTLNVTDSGGFSIGVYRLINYGGALTYNGLSIGLVPAGFTAGDLFVQTTVAGQINLIVGTSNVVFWDGSHASPNGVIDGGSGNWNQASTNWTDASGSFNRAWPGNFAVFTGASGLVTITQSVNSTGMQFLTDGYTIGADVGQTITLAGATSFRVDPGLSATISAPLTGAGSLTKLDAGTLVLLGGNSYTGGTTVQAGQLSAGATGALGTGPVSVGTGATLLWFNSASALALNIVNTTNPAVAGGGTTAFTQNSSAGASIITNQANNGNATSSGARLRFRDNSDAGTSIIFNEAATLFGPGQNSGATLFSDNASAAGATFTNQGGALNVGGVAFNASTQFSNNSRGGTATFFNEGGIVAGSVGGYTLFSDTTTAESASITNLGGTVAGATGGSLIFLSNATAANATIINAPGAVVSAQGGLTTFSNNSTAANAHISNNSATTSSGSNFGGALQFFDFTSAGHATIDNQGSLLTSGFGGGATDFFNNATAANSTITNFGGRNTGAGPGGIGFHDDTTAGFASISNLGGAASGASGGAVSFSERATAGSATITNGGGTVTGANGGVTSFYNTSNAGAATFTNAAATAGGLTAGGQIVFRDASSASNAVFTNLGATTVNASIIAGGSVYFTDSSSAGNATINNLGATASGSEGGATVFQGSATAGTATILNLGGTVNGAGGGYLEFLQNSTAGSATIINTAGTFGGATNVGTAFFSDTSSAGNATLTNAGGGVTGASGGFTTFSNSASAGGAIITNGAQGAAGAGSGLTQFKVTSTAGAAVITNAGAAVAGAGGGLTQFFDNSTAANGVFHNLGGTADGAGSGQTQFYGNSSAGSSTLYADAGLGNAAGGAIIFFESSSGGDARVILNGTGNAAGGLDISQILSSSISIGSIEGTGIVSLGSRTLVVGTNNLSTTFSGLIRDGGFIPATGGSLTVLGGGRLTLSGANTYTGVTNIGNGFILNSGKLVVTNTTGSATGTGPVFVNFGGTLGGSGFIAGPVTLRAGGLIAPGDPVTLTLQDRLTWDGGGSIRLVLGVNSASSDHLDVGSLVRGANGEFLISLINGGAVVGETYDLIHFDSLVGFSVSDFSVNGMLGTFELVDGALDFTVLTIPEPGVLALLVMGTFPAFLALRRVSQGAERRRRRLKVERRKQGD